MKNLIKQQCLKAIPAAVIVILLAFASASASQPGLAVYPAKGQTPGQQKQDESACQQWAMEQTGHDPHKKPLPQVQMKTSVGSQATKGAAGGGLVGAGIGAVAGSTGTGAAIGAGVGAAALGVKESKTQQQRDAEYKQYIETYNKEVESFTKAQAACLEGRGYTVK